MALRERWDGFTYAWRHLPIGELHPSANGAALAAEGAAEQDAFWAYHHVLLARQDALSVPDLLNYAGQIGLEVAKLMDDMLEGRHAERILDDVRSAVALRGARPRRRCSSRACAGTAAGSRTRWRARCVQPWPGEVLEERAGEIAVAFAALLTRQAAWRHRRVETITVLSHERVRRHVSVDFTVPAAHRDEIELSDGEWVVPLALAGQAAAGATSTCFMEDETAVPLLRSDEAQLIARELLYLMLDLDTEDAIEEDVAPLIEWILAAGPEEAAQVDAAVEELEEQLGPLPGFAALAAPADARVPAVRGGERRVAAAGDQVRLRPAARAARGARRTSTTRRAARRRRRYHAEVAVPEEMRARTTEMVDDRTGAVLAAGPRDTDRPAIHYVAEPDARIEPGAERELRHRARPLPRPGGAGGVGDRARARAAVAVRRPAARWRGRASPAIAILLSSSAIVQRPRAAQRRAPAGPADARALPRCAWRRRRSPRCVAGGALAFHGSAGTLDVDMGSRRPCGRPVSRYPDC